MVDKNYLFELLKPFESIKPLDIAPLPNAGYYKLIDLSCKLLDDGTVEARGTEIVIMGKHDSTETPDERDTLQSMSIGTPNQFTGTGLYMDHDKPPEKVVTSSAMAEKKGGLVDHATFASGIAKHQLQKCFAQIVPSV